MKFELKKTALLTLDLQQGILGMYPRAGEIIPAAQRAVGFARAKGLKVIHVGVGFSEGHPEIPDYESMFLRIKQNNLFVRGSASAEFHSSLAQPGDFIVYKQRIGAFSGSNLQLILRSQGIEHLVFFGVSTSGIVLSTIRHAFDLDYRMTVLSDACFDADTEVHRVLVDKVFPKQATVTKVDYFIAEQT
jgi:nicotinamidase-related amidase